MSFDALRYCDILTINNRYFQFRHQLFHKLTIASWDGFDKQKYSYFFMMDDNNTDDKIRLLGGIGAWSKMQNPQYEEHQKNNSQILSSSKVSSVTRTG